MAPPRALLEWLVENVGSDVLESAREKRRLLGERDEATIAEALQLVASHDHAYLSRAWFLFEGPTSIDGYLETDDAIVVIEGKRTERVPTTKTKWMPVRHQMLRNLDAVWDLRGEKRVCGFFVVGGDDDPHVPDEWEDFARDTVSTKAIEGSLPHRDEDERRRIAAAFLGVTTWGRICSEFGIDFESLPKDVAGV